MRVSLFIPEKIVETLGGQLCLRQVQRFTDFSGSGIISVEVHKHDDFENANGSQINQLYLELIGGKTAIGLRLAAKCEAVAFLYEKIEAFFVNNLQRST